MPAITAWGVPYALLVGRHGRHDAHARIVLHRRAPHTRPGARRRLLHQLTIRNGTWGTFLSLVDEEHCAIDGSGRGLIPCHKPHDVNDLHAMMATGAAKARNSHSPAHTSMDSERALPLSPVSPVVFQDGLGQRRQMVAAGNQTLTVLILKQELVGVSSFEAALRDRVGHLAGFQHRSFARVQGIAHLPNDPSSLAIASDYVPGVRLSEILALAEQRLIPLEIDAAFCLIRQLVSAVAALHEKVPDACHGAVAPERIIITREARPVLVEHVLGAALEQLQFSRERYWKELRIPLPPSGPPRFDSRADVTQLGTLALALILGRPLADDEYPARIADIVNGVRAISATGLELLPAGVHAWLCRALQLDARGSFANAGEALVELAGIADSNRAHAALESFLAQCYAARMSSGARASGSVVSSIPSPPKVDPVPEPRAARPTVAADTPSPRIDASPVLRADRPTVAADSPAPRIDPSPEPRAAQAIVAADTPIPRFDPSPALRAARPTVGADTPAHRIEPSPALRTAEAIVAADKPAARIDASPDRQAARPTFTLDDCATIRFAPPAKRVEPFTWPPVKEAETSSQSEEPGGLKQKRTAPPRARLIAAAVVLIAMASGATLAARWYLKPGLGPTGTLVVNTSPSGVPVAIDGEPRGSSPLTIDLSAGNHVLEVATQGQVRKIPVTITDGGQVAQFIELSGVAPAPIVGQLDVRTDPAGARVSIDGESRGVSPLTLEGLTPGVHTVTLEGSLSTATEKVTIIPGATASLVVPLAGRPGAPASGWISITAPVDVQVYEKERLLGTSQSDRIMVTAGPHELTLVNDALGYRSSRVVQVVPGSVSAIRLDWPKGSLALNALPWAEVWVDGERLGETPIGSVQVPIGPHDVVFRHPELGEQSHKVTVTLTAPARVSADLRTP
jgi:serine/threonine protein kinase